MSKDIKKAEQLRDAVYEAYLKELLKETKDAKVLEILFDHMTVFKAYALQIFKSEE